MTAVNAIAVRSLGCRELVFLVAWFKTCFQIPVSFESVLVVARTARYGALSPGLKEFSKTSLICGSPCVPLYGYVGIRGE